MVEPINGSSPSTPPESPNTALSVGIDAQDGCGPLRVPRNRASQQQTGHVGARDQKHQADRAQEQP